MILGVVHRSPGICFKADETPRKPQLGDRLIHGMISKSRCLHQMVGLPTLKLFSQTHAHKVYSYILRCCVCRSSRNHEYLSECEPKFEVESSEMNIPHGLLCYQTLTNIYNWRLTELHGQMIIFVKSDRPCVSKGKLVIIHKLAPLLISFDVFEYSPKSKNIYWTR